jgi:flagellar protein FliJ
MKKYEFRMAKVLRVRRLQEDAARAAVAAARVSENAAVAALHASREHLAALDLDAGMQAHAEFLERRTVAAWRGDAVGQAGVRRQIAADTTAVAVDGWHLANQRVTALERLDERRREEYEVLARRDEDATVDEIVTSRVRRTA